jgi:hypothetical protein
VISARKLRANRANSLRSTGPKSAAGRARSAQNARRHGLGTPVLSDPALSAEVEIMAQRIAGSAHPELLELARRPNVATAAQDAFPAPLLREKSAQTPWRVLAPEVSLQVGRWNVLSLLA